MRIWKQRQQGKPGTSSDRPTAFDDTQDAISRQFHLRRSPSDLPSPVGNSTSRTSLDIPGRINNFIQKSTSGLDLASTSNSHSKTTSPRFPRTRTASTSNISSASNGGSPNRLVQSRKWVNNLLHSGNSGADKLETTAQARSRASFDLSRASPAFVSSLVLSSGNNDDDLSTKPVYTLESGLKRGNTKGARPASVYSSHLSSASRSNPELHRGSVTRHLDNGAMAMDIAPTLASLATTSRLDVEPTSSSRLEVRNVGETSLDSSVMSFPLPSHVMQNQNISNPPDLSTTNTNAYKSEEEGDIDASIAHDRLHRLLGREEEAVLDMLNTMSPAASAAHIASVPPIAAPSPNNTVMSPKISALLQSLSIETAPKASRQISTPVHDMAAMERSRSLSPSKTIARVPVPMMDSLSSPKSSSSFSPSNVAFPSSTQRVVVSPLDSSLPGSSAAFSGWSRGNQSPNTPSSSQDPYSPLRSASSGPTKWSASNNYFNLNNVGKGPNNNPTYGLGPVSSPDSQMGADNVFAPLKAARAPPQLHRHMTDFTAASSVSEGDTRSQHGNFQKEAVQDHGQPISGNSRLSSTRSTGSSLAAMNNEQEKATSASTMSHGRPTYHSDNGRASSVRSGRNAPTSRPATPSKIALPASPTKARDLIKMFENNSATASPSEQSQYFSPALTPRRNLSPSKELDADVVSLKSTPKRHTPLALSLLKSNFSTMTPPSQGLTNVGSPTDAKGNYSEKYHGTDDPLDVNGSDGYNENETPSSLLSSDSQSRPNGVQPGLRFLSNDSRRLSRSIGSKPASISSIHRNSEADGFLKPMQGSSLLLARRQSAQSDHETSKSTLSADAQGSATSYRHKREEGNLPLFNATAIQMSGEPSGSKPVRAGALLYFNVHDDNPRWLSVNAVLLPGSIAMSWIPSGGGRENVVLDLAACREVHSVPSPDHPSSVTDIGAIGARRQKLDHISPFQLLFDDGVERLAADTVKARMQWVVSFKEVTGTASPRVGSIAESFTVNSGHNTSFGQAISAIGGSVAPSVPPKDAINVSQSPPKAQVVSTPFTTTSTVSSGQVRAKIQSWQRPTESSNESLARDFTHKAPTSSASAAGLARSTPLFADARSNLGSHAESRAKPSSPPSPVLGLAKSVQDNFETGWKVPSQGDRTPTDSPGGLDGYESALSHNSVSDEFGPRTPASEVVFHWDRLDKESDLEPSDSASQRPARSEYGTIRSNVSLEYRPSMRSMSDEKGEPNILTYDTDKADIIVRTPAQVIRDSVVGASRNISSIPIVISDEDAEKQSDRLGTVVEETPSQAQSTSVYNSLRSSTGTGPLGSDYRSIPNSMKAGTAMSMLSLASDSSFSSQDVGKLLEYLEVQNRDRLNRDQQLEKQMKGFQQIVANLQTKGTLGRSSSKKRRNSAGSLGGDSRISARSDHESELSAMQEKLDKVLELVASAVVAPHPKHFRGQSEPASAVMVDAEAEDVETAKVEAILAKLLRKMQRKEDDMLTKSAGIPMDADPDRQPVVSLLNVSSAGGHRGSVAVSESSDYSRMTPRSWTSERGIPSPPPNSEWEAKSTSSHVALEKGPGQAASARTPVQDIRMLGDTGSSQATPRPVLVGSERSCGSVDMEVEVRKRRAHQKEASGTAIPLGQVGGWYTLKSDELRAAERNTAQAPTTDKPVPPTPGVSWAADNTAAVTRTESMNKGLLRKDSMAVNGQAQHAGPKRAAGVASGDLGDVLLALKQNEMARQAEMRQQADISRYLNELNVWLEKDVADRSKEWKSLATGVAKLHEELRALKKEAAPVATASDQSVAVPAANPTITLSDASDAKAKQTAVEPILVPHDNVATTTSPSKRGSLPPIPRSGGKSVTFANSVDTSVIRDPKGLQPSQTTDKSKWIHNDVPMVFGNIKKASASDNNAKSKSQDSKAAAVADGAALVRSALCELEKFKATQRSQGKPESPLPAEAKDNAETAAKLPLPDTIWTSLKDAADKGDHQAIADSIRVSAASGYGATAVVKLADHVESKAQKDGSAPAGDDTKAAFIQSTEDEGMHSMQTPVPRSYKAKEKEPDAVRDKTEDSTPIEMGDSGPSTSTLALAVEEILKHLLEQKRQQAEAEAERKTAEEAREQALGTLKEQEKAELVNMLYSKISEAKAAEDASREAKAKEMDPKTAIELLVEAINSQKINELQSQQAADVAIRQMTSELLKSTTEQNQKMVDAVNAASRDMLRTNVQMHAEEFKRILHKEVTNMFEDVGKIREAKRHLEFEIADLWSIKSRHLQAAATSGLPITYSVPGEFPPQGQQQNAFPQALPRPQIKQAQPPPYPPGNIKALPPTAAAASPSKPVKAATPSAPPQNAAAPPAPAPVQTMGNLSPSKQQQFAFGPRQPLYR